MTYSIVARDRETGQLGVAVQSHYFSVGPIVPWAEAGVGAVATQASGEPGYGPRGLARMRAGEPAPQVLEALLADDPERETRQVAMVDAQGRVGVHTGRRCISEAGALAGEGFSAQANMMARASVWPAMANAFAAAKGELELRLLAALDAAEAEGGDIRGRQSAAILVVSEVASAVLTPGNGELDFWTAMTAARLGELERARALLDGISRTDARWRELARRLVPIGLLSREAADALGV